MQPHTCPPCMSLVLPMHSTCIYLVSLGIMLISLYFPILVIIKIPNDGVRMVININQDEDDGGRRENCV